MNFRSSALLTLCSAGLLVAGCGGGDDPTGIMTYAIETTTPALSVGQDSLVSISASVRNVTEDRVLTGARLAYRSLDYSIATVDTLGRVRGIKGGDTDIEVLFRDDLVRIPVTVRPNPIQELQMRLLRSNSNDTGVVIAADGRSAELGSGVGFSFVSGQRAEMALLATDATGDTLISLRPATFSGVNGRIPSIQRRGVFSSTNTAVATVSNSGSTFGRVTAVAPGSAMIIFTVPGDELADTVNVTVYRRPLTGVRVQIADPANPQSALANHPLAIRRGGQLTLLATPTASRPDGDAVDRRVEWSLDTPALGTIDVLGVVRAVDAASAVGDTLIVRATSVPIAGVDTAVSGFLRLVVTTNQ